MKMKRDQLIGGILTIMGIAALLMSVPIKVKTGSTDPGSRIFPLMASVLLLICGIGVMLTAKGGENKQFLEKDGWIKIIISFVIMIGYIFALKYIGFIISTPVFLYIITTLLSNGEKLSIWRKLVYAVIITACFWLLLHSALKMNLPKGILF